MNEEMVWIMANDLKDCACMNLRKAARLIAQYYDQRLQPSGLRNTQFTLLVTIGHFTPISVSLLAKRMSTDRTTLTRNVRVLERDGLLASQPCKDARVRALILTKQGQNAIDETRPYWEVAQTKFLQKFGKKRWALLKRELDALVDVIDEA